MGHVDIIGRASQLFDEVIVAVVNQSVRKSNAIFGIEEGVELTGGQGGSDLQMPTPN